MIIDIFDPRFTKIVDKIFPAFIHRKTIVDLNNHCELLHLINTTTDSGIKNQDSYAFLKDFYSSVNIPLKINIRKKPYFYSKPRNGLNIIRHPADTFGTDFFLDIKTAGILAILNISSSTKETLGLNDTEIEIPTGEFLFIIVAENEKIKLKNYISENEIVYIWFIIPFLQRVSD